MSSGTGPDEQQQLGLHSHPCKQSCQHALGSELLTSPAARSFAAGLKPSCCRAVFPWVYSSLRVMPVQGAQ